MSKLKCVLIAITMAFLAVDTGNAAGDKAQSTANSVSATAAKSANAVPSTVAKPAVGAPEKQGETADKVIVVDDFERGEQPNNLGGISQGKEEFPGGCIPSFVDDPKIAFGGKGYSLRLDYEVTPPGAFSYYVTRTGAPGRVAGTTVPLDLTGYKYLSFWMRPDTSKPEFMIDIHEDRDGDGFFVQGKDGVSRVDVKRFIEVGKKNQWQKVVIPLRAFKKVKDWSKILEIAIVFENKKDKLGQEQKGTIYFDEISFGTLDPEEGNTTAGR